MLSCTRRHAFSLVETLVSLSILAIIAAIVVPRLLGVGSQVQQTANTTSLDNISKAAQQWKDSGGTFDPSDTYAAFHLIQFLSTPSNGQPDRGFRVNPATGGPGIDPTNTCTDSTMSRTVCVAAYVDASSSTKPAKASQDGFYAKMNSGMNGDTKPPVASGINLYQKQGNQIYPIDAQNNDLATMIFIRTGSPGNL